MVTPLSDQPQGYTAGKPHAWRSETLKVAVTVQGKVRVSRSADALPDSTYDGGWKIHELDANEPPG